MRSSLAGQVSMKNQALPPSKIRTLRNKPQGSATVVSHHPSGKKRKRMRSEQQLLVAISDPVLKHFKSGIRPHIQFNGTPAAPPEMKTLAPLEHEFTLVNQSHLTTRANNDNQLQEQTEDLISSTGFAIQNDKLVNEGSTCNFGNAAAESNDKSNYSITSRPQSSYRPQTQLNHQVAEQQKLAIKIAYSAR